MDAPRKALSSCPHSGQGFLCAARRHADHAFALSHRSWNLHRHSGMSRCSSAQSRVSSRAISSDTSRDQPSAVLKPMTRTGLEQALAAYLHRPDTPAIPGEHAALHQVAVAIAIVAIVVGIVVVGIIAIVTVWVAYSECKCTERKSPPVVEAPVKTSSAKTMGRECSTAKSTTPNSGRAETSGSDSR